MAGDGFEGRGGVKGRVFLSHGGEGLNIAELLAGLLCKCEDGKKHKSLPFFHVEIGIDAGALRGHSSRFAGEVIPDAEGDLVASSFGIAQIAAFCGEAGPLNATKAKAKTIVPQ